MNKYGAPIKVLQLQPNFDAAITYVGEQISKALSEENCDMTTAYLRGSSMRGVESSSEKTHCFRFPKERLKGLSRWIYIWKLYRYIKKNKFDIIIVHRFKPIHMLLLANRLLKIPVIGIVHGIGDYDRNYRQKIVKSHVTEKWRFVAVSADVKKYMVNLSCGFGENNTHVITNAIDIEKVHREQLSREEARKALGVQQNVFLFGAVGRLVPVKGYQYIIKAMNRLGSHFPEAQVVIVGSGRMKDELQSLIEENGVANSVKLVGWKDGAARYVRAFDVFIICSLTEGMPLALLEAMAGKVPAIASNIPSLKPLIDNAGGWCFRPGDDSELASVMENTLHLANSDLKEIGETAFNYILQEHSLERFYNGYRSLVSSQLANNS